MPLRDHFRPPLDNLTSWEGFHGQWPAVIVQHLRKRLPAGYVAEPSVDLLRSSRRAKETAGWRQRSGHRPRPTVAVETTLPDYDEYEVRIYDATRRRHLVAAIEIVSPANKDRPEHRNIFVAKCAALLQKGVAVASSIWLRCATATFTPSCWPSSATTTRPWAPSRRTFTLPPVVGPRTENGRCWNCGRTF